MEREEKIISSPVPEYEGPGMTGERRIEFGLHIDYINREVEMRVYLPRTYEDTMTNLGFEWDYILNYWIGKFTPLDVYKILVYFDAAFGDVNWSGALESCKSLGDFRYTLRHLQAEFGLPTDEFDNPFLRGE